MAQTAETAVEQAAPQPRLLFFHSPKCGKSRRVEGYIAQVLQRRGNHGTFAQDRIDIDERPDLAERFRVAGVPTLLVVSDKRVRGRLAEPRGCRQIKDLLAPWLVSAKSPTQTETSNGEQDHGQGR
jgi:thioredoxin-like negative regulator of GroEL